ncbi:MAG: SpoIIE family protein phosphatase [Gammaproteobacteria bacterium]|nr:SpoIIE family protein phosphatase [Gammaproteobacteria bacterium]
MKKLLKTVLIICSNGNDGSGLAQTLFTGQNLTITVSESGEQGIVEFYRQPPELIVIYPVSTDVAAFDLCSQLKALTTQTSVPIMLAADELDEQCITRYIDAGVDDIVYKWIPSSAFRLKLYSLFRRSEIYQQLYQLTAQKQHDEELAEQLFSRVVEKGNIAERQIKIFKRSADTFSGDVQITAACPNGDINILLGDFTGHGLSSAIGAIPLAETFRAMTAKGYDQLAIIRQINRKMHSILPTQMFLALSMVTLSVSERVAYVWNSGMEDVLIFDNGSGKLVKRIGSFHPPLGISSNLFNESTPRVIPLGEQDRIIMYSDGLVEARNPAGEMFGEQHFVEAVTLGLHHNTVQQNIISALEFFCEDTEQDDDISLVDISCDMAAYPIVNDKLLAEASTVSQTMTPRTDWQWNWDIALAGDKLINVNPVPIIMNQIQEMEGTGEHWHNLYTVLTELYVNALDHGILGLDSAIKSSPQGFAQYFEEKEQRLSETFEGYIKFKLKHYGNSEGGALDITITDSGSGFEFTPWIEQQDDMLSDTLVRNSFSGRGIKLVRALCQELSYHEGGRTAKALYVWHK